MGNAYREPAYTRLIALLHNFASSLLSVALSFPGPDRPCVRVRIVDRKRRIAGFRAVRFSLNDSPPITRTNELSTSFSFVEGTVSDRSILLHRNKLFFSKRYRYTRGYAVTRLENVVKFMDFLYRVGLDVVEICRGRWFEILVVAATNGT